MKDLEELLTSVVADLEHHGVGWALVGGLAVSARTEPRFTRDVDLVVAVGGDEEAEALTRSLAERGWRVSATLEQEAARRLAAARLVPSGGDASGRVVDLLFASSGIEGEVVAAAEELELLPGVRTPVARTGHLIVLKALASAPDRPQDAADLTALLAEADQPDRQLAREAARLVEDRGFHRGRDLVAEIERLLGV